MKTAIPATAVWLRRIGDHAEVLVEIDGRGWCLAVREHLDGPFSHIAEGNGAHHWPPDHPATTPGDGYVVINQRADIGVSDEALVLLRECEPIVAAWGPTRHDLLKRVRAALAGGQP